jgi:chromosome segregation ATPase
MDLSDATEPRIVSVEADRDDGLQILESAMCTVAAVNRFIANFERVKEERDSFEGQLADARAENEGLRKKISDGESRHNHLSQTVATLADQMQTIAARSLEAVKVVRAQIDQRAPMTQLSLPAMDDQRASAEQAAQPNTFLGKSSPIAEASRVVQVFSQYLTQPTRVTGT